MTTKMRKIFILLILLFPASLVMAASNPVDVLRQYYRADQAEDIDTMMFLTDFSQVDVSELTQFRVDAKKMLETMAFVFDTKSYEISQEKTLTGTNDAYVFYHLKDQVQDKNGKTLDEDRDYVAVMHKVAGEWKIVYMQPRVLFEQNNMMRDLTVSAGISVVPVLDFFTGKRMVGGLILWALRVLFVIVAILGIVAIILFLIRFKAIKRWKKVLVVSGIIILTFVILYYILYFSGAIPN